MNIVKFCGIALFMSIFTVSCNNDNEFFDKIERTELQVSTSTKGTTRAIIPGGPWQTGGESIGVSLYDASGNPYTGISSDSENIKYTSSNSGSRVVWSSLNPIELNKTIGQAIAYYPYVSGGDIEAIPLSVQLYQDESNQVDYMYSDWVQNINNMAPAALFKMNHVLSAFDINVKKGTYKGTGSIHSVIIYSRSLSADGILNAKTGAITGCTKLNSRIDRSDTGTLSSYSPYNAFLTAIPTNAINDLKIDVSLDNKTYTVTVPMTTPFKKGKRYIIDIIANESSTPLSLLEVRVKDWVREKVPGTHILK